MALRRVLPSAGSHFGTCHIGVSCVDMVAGKYRKLFKIKYLRIYDWRLLYFGTNDALPLFRSSPAASRSRRIEDSERRRAFFH